MGCLVSDDLDLLQKGSFGYPRSDLGSRALRCRLGLQVWRSPEFVGVRRLGKPFPLRVVGSYLILVGLLYGPLRTLYMVYIIRVYGDSTFMDPYEGRMVWTTGIRSCPAGLENNVHANFGRGV